MATVRLVNVAVPGPDQNHDHYQMWRLTREMLNAGWVIVEASDGTTKTAGSGWTTLAESQNANSWCALARPGNTTWGHLFWFRNVAGLFGGVTPSAFQYYTTSGWNTSASTPTVPPVPADGQDPAYYKISGLQPPTFGSIAGARNWFAGKFALTMTHCNFFLMDDSVNDDYSIVTWGYGSYNGSSAGQGAMPSFFAWSAVDGAVETTTGNGDPYAFFCHNEAGEWDLGGDFPNNFGQNAIRAIVPHPSGPSFLFLERGTSAVLNRPTPGEYIFTNSTFRDVYASANTLYLESIFAMTTSGLYPIYKGHMRWVRMGLVAPNGGLYDVADEAGGFNWARTVDSSIVVPWDGTTNQQLPFAAVAATAASLMFAKTGVVAPPTLPTVTMTAPAANPCDPRANITVDYEYTGAGGTAVCTLTVIANGDTDRSAMIYNGDPTTNTPSESAPSDFYEIVSQTDDGTTGQIVLRPITGKYWPVDLTTWTAIIESDVGTSASSTDTQNVDATLIPPSGDTTDPVVSGQSPSPGSVINPNTAVSFSVTDNVALRTVFVFVAFAGTDAREVVHDGTSFTPNYAGASTRTGTSAAYAYTVRRFGGWPASPTFTALPIDTSGNAP